MADVGLKVDMVMPTFIARGCNMLLELLVVELELSVVMLGGCVAVMTVICPMVNCWCIEHIGRST